MTSYEDNFPKNKYFFILIFLLDWTDGLDLCIQVNFRMRQSIFSQLCWHLFQEHFLVLMLLQKMLTQLTESVDTSENDSEYTNSNHIESDTDNLYVKIRAIYWESYLHYEFTWYFLCYFYKLFFCSEMLWIQMKVTFSVTLLIFCTNYPCRIQYDLNLCIPIHFPTCPQIQSTVSTFFEGASKRQNAPETNVSRVDWISTDASENDLNTQVQAVCSIQQKNLLWKNIYFLESYGRMNSWYFFVYFYKGIFTTENLKFNKFKRIIFIAPYLRE